VSPPLGPLLSGTIDPGAVLADIDYEDR